MDLYESLSTLGFSKNEIKILLFMKDNNPSNVTKISRKLAIHRSNVYDTLAALENKKLVYKIGIKYYLASKKEYMDHESNIINTMRDTFELILKSNSTKQEVENNELTRINFILSKFYPHINYRIRQLLKNEKVFKFGQKTYEWPNNANS